MGDFKATATAFTLWWPLCLAALHIQTTFVAADTTCPYLVQQNTKFRPACEDTDVAIKWPDYENASLYYVCLAAGRPAQVPCPAGQYFIFVLQTCGSCDQYIRPVNCNKLPTKNPPVCTNDEDNPPTQANTSLPTPRYPSTTPTANTSSPKTKPTLKPSTPSTATPITPDASTGGPATEKTKRPPKTPPTPPTPTDSGSKPTPPSITVSPPPSPPSVNTKIPLPPTPAPTPPVVNIEPPYQTPRPKIASISDKSS